MFRALTVSALLASFALAPTAFAQPAPQIVITSPANGATVPGPDVTVTIQVTGTTLVPAPNATQLTDMHVHYLLDVDPSPYVSGTTPIPMGNPNIIHTANLSNVFSGVAPGPHRVTLILGLANHLAVQPPVAPSVSFIVAGQTSVPTQLPHTGEASGPSTLPLLAGFVLALLGIAVLGAARSGLGHRR